MLTPMTPTGQRRTGSDLRNEALTAKELESLRWVAQGFSNDEIVRASKAASLYTVKSRLKSAYGKLGADNAAHAVLLAIAAGWLDPVTGIPNRTPIPPSSRARTPLDDYMNFADY
jgi:DNA-binding CsgD family transcriptional regulator